MVSESKDLSESDCCESAKDTDRGYLEYAINAAYQNDSKLVQTRLDDCLSKCSSEEEKKVEREKAARAQADLDEKHVRWQGKLVKMQKPLLDAVEGEEPESGTHSKLPDLSELGQENELERQETDEDDDEDRIGKMMSMMSQGEEDDDEPSGVSAARTSMFTRALNGSALHFPIGAQAVIYVIAVGGILFVLIAKATKLGDEGDGGHGSSSSAAAGSSGSHRRLGAGPPPLLEKIAYSLTGAGVITFFVNVLQQPLILGYLLGGMFVGPVCLDIVHSVSDIQDFSSLGLVFLLFMVGLELDVKQLLQMGKVVIFTGLLQFPLCVGLHSLFFMALSSIGLDFGIGDKSVFYCALTCGISSTMIVVKLLSECADMDSPSGRLTIGILIFQDIWAIIVLAIQPDLANPQVTKLLKTFAMIVVLIVVALAYAKFVMPVVFMASSRNVELMLVISLCWCFFMCSFAILPFIGLSMELAALVSGVALATYPYSAEFNGKIKYVRDFFITIFFCGLGMQIPAPKPEPILTALVIAAIVLVTRWVGIFALVLGLGGGTRLAAVATINLSEVSEFALVICSLGVNYEHIDNDTLTIMIWVFALLAVMSANLLPFNYKIYALLVGIVDRCRGRDFSKSYHHESDEHDSEDRNIVILGFHKIAAMLIYTLKHEAPEILHKVQVVDFNEKTLSKLRAKGLAAAYGDISCPDVLEHAVHGSARLVLITIPDTLLRGTSNMKLLKVAQQVWPEAKVFVTADNPADTELLYKEGADYVLRMSSLCAEKLVSIMKEFTEQPAHVTDWSEQGSMSTEFSTGKSGGSRQTSSRKSRLDNFDQHISRKTRVNAKVRPSIDARRSSTMTEDSVVEFK